MELKQVFISYADEDISIAQIIHEYLQKQGIVPFLARVSIPAGQNWSAKIDSAIKDSDSLVLIWSRNSATSKWVNYELARAQVMDKKVLPCAIDNTQYHQMINSLQVLHWKNNAPNDSLVEISKALGLKQSEQPSGGASGFEPTLENAMVKYQKVVVDKHFQLPILGSGDQIAMDDAYLPLRVSHCNDTNAEEQHLAYELLQSMRGRAVVLGHPGTGKTTLLKFVAFKTAQKRGYTTPIFISIPLMMKTSTSIIDYMRILIQGLTNQKIASLIVDDEKFGQEDTILLLDGFDEIKESGREEFMPRLNQFLTAYPNCTVFVASRMSTFEGEPFAALDFDFYQISALTDDDIKTYISKYAPEGVRNHLWSTIQSNERLFELAQVPFMLAMICATGSELGTVVDRASLFGKCTQYLLKTRQEDGRKTVDQELEDALKAIAVHFFKLDAKKVFEKEDIEFAVSKAVKTLPPEDAVRKIARRTGLIQRAEGGYHFIHRSIWEYYVALGMKDEPLNNLFDHVSVDRWEEPVKLYIGLTEVSELEIVVRGIWERNRGLALRALMELPDFPEPIVRDLVLNLDRADRVRLAHEIIGTAAKSGNIKQQRRILLDSISALLRVEKDCEVIYYCVKALEEFDDDGCRQFVQAFLDIEHSSRRRNRYIADDKYKFEFVSLTDGEFMMGLDDSPDPRERPAHRVNLTAFEIGKYLVTNSVYFESFPFAVDKRDAYSQDDDQPVNNVTWFEAIVFAWWLGCDLPTEAEWEFACRSGGIDDRLFFDTSIVPEYAWYGGNSQNRTHRVGQKKANTFGIYDMLGNVREWVKDWFSETEFYQECSKCNIIKDPVCYKRGDRKVLRGGVFDWSTTNLRPTYRPMNPPDNVFFGNGLRLVYRKGKPVPYLQLEGHQ